MTLFFTWTILGAIINPTKMLPYASIFVAVVSFVWAKYTSLKSMEKEARDFIQDIVKDELQRLVGKTDIQKNRHVDFC